MGFVIQLKTKMFTSAVIRDGTFRQKISKEREYLNNNLNQLDLTYIKHPATAGYTFFSSAHETFSRDRPYVKPQNKFQYILIRLKSYKVFSSFKVE